MEKITKIYLNGLIFGREWKQKEVVVMDPELVNVSQMTRFYFSEQTLILDGEDVYEGKMKKCSPTYYIGTRVSILDLMNRPNMSDDSLSYLKKLYEENPNISICENTNGIISIMGEEDMTLDEYISAKKNTK